MLKLISSVILAAILMIAGVVYASSSGDKPKYENTLPYEDKTANLLRMEENVKSILNESITKTIDYMRTGAMYDGRYVWEASCVEHTLSAIKDSTPVELTGSVEDGSMYTVFRVNDEKIGDYYTYVFFRYVSQKDEPEFKPTSEDERWQIAGREIRISKRLSAKDFENISVGSTIKEVTAVDPVTAVSLPKGDYIGTDPFLSFDTFHYTDDGILRISFTRKTIDNEFLVSEIELNSSYEVPPFDGSDLGEELSPIKLKINPEHLPD